MSRILIAVLNWGMGHASRTLPIIEGALDLGWEVDVASTGDALIWLKNRLENRSGVTFFDKPGAAITYSHKFTMLKLVAQTPKILLSISEEKKWTAKHVKARSITKIFSDNCLGTYDANVPSVLMTHLLKFPVPRPFSPVAQFLIRRFARRFSEVWVPDLPPGPTSISGPLTSKTIHPDTKFIGILSRLTTPSKDLTQTSTTPYPLVGIVSGPEPHRTTMENALRKWMQNRPEKGIIFAGKPGKSSRLDGEVFTHYDPSDVEISEAICASQILICRSGYTSLLDLVALKKRAILIPTPGQMEQEVLSAVWSEKFGFASCTQKDLNNLMTPEMSGRFPPELFLKAPNKTAMNELAAWLKN
jgi:hypothetical protein